MPSDDPEIRRAQLEEALAGLPPAVVERYFRPRNRGELKQPDGFGTRRSDCDDTIEIYLKVQGDLIVNLSFISHGCGNTQACASMATELAGGRTLVEALEVDGEAIVAALGGLPEHNRHCADLAAAALHDAVRDALCTGHEPWKRLYR